jgi:hypothetical protein
MSAIWVGLVALAVLLALVGGWRMASGHGLTI